MPEPPSDKVDVEVLAAEGAELERRYPLAGFPRLADVLAAPGGEATARFRFRTLAEGVPGCDLAVEAEATLRCERCLETYGHSVDSSTRLAFITRESDAGRVPEDFEAVPLDAGRASLAELVEDELLLALPVVARHGEGSPCAARAATDDSGDEAAVEEETHRPFAGLRDLLKR